MMPIVIHHANAPGATAKLKTAVDAAEVFKRTANRFNIDVKAYTGRDRGGRIQDVMQSGHVQNEVSQVLSAVAHTKVTERAVLARLGLNRTRLDQEIAVTTCSICHHASLNL